MRPFGRIITLLACAALALLGQVSVVRAACSDYVHVRGAGAERLVSAGEAALGAPDFSVPGSSAAPAVEASLPPSAPCRGAHCSRRGPQEDPAAPVLVKFAVDHWAHAGASVSLSADTRAAPCVLVQRSRPDSLAGQIFKPPCN